MGATTVHSSASADGVKVTSAKEQQKDTPRKPSLWQGIVLAAGLAVVATVLGNWLPTVGGPVFAILLGLMIRNTMGMMPVFQPGLVFSSKKVLQWSIIALGFGLSLNQVVQTGLESLWVTLITMAAAFIVAAVLGRMLGVPDKLRTLIGAGTAICGGSAIAAVAPIIKPEEHETAFAISTIFLFNVVAVLVFPFFGHFLNMSDVGFGLWAGTAINDTSSVVAAAYSYSTEAGDYATVVKLTRATFIIPICLFYVFLEVRRQKKEGTGFSITRLIPWFIVWFVVASAVRSTGLLPAELLSVLQFLAKFLMVLALAAIGLSSNMRVMAKAGWQPVVLGLGVWVAVTLTSLAVQQYSGAW
ncbi:YeiH family protein [Paenalcaligenes faecalis]|uniref:YeiH family protein n=1 Tax=Paenalcaligenes faecalis TaxID=2980099 RepID=UPI0022B95E92|nr:YeiH family protein [Paenalcaligenes faecalis]